MHHTICYVSTATREFSGSEINELLALWKEKNEEQDIKGILLYSEGHFFQVLEGERSAVLALFSEINNDKRHSGIIQVLGKDIERGSLDGYRTEHLSSPNFSRPDLIRNYCESVEGMDSHTQGQIKTVLNSFLDTRVL
ncbi:BLUF domain-containing protein [Salinimicrobium oceani]|uniref:BLUF domain-containing protein n=1 Tax=Salinimicrobium oceani TaxID=2722702 RepID=A0ABX1D185_9FLAO|nr:BLUF domain-containing protein [Salinimicrobium oceani]NJW53827.1 BLUF domain-containing protein [Salinimicrobium oceani]